MKSAVTFLLVALIGLIMAVAYVDVRTENKRLTNNIVALTEMLNTQNQYQQKSISVLTMSVNEVKQNLPELEHRIKKELNVKLKDVAQVSNFETKTNTTFKTIVKDSIVLDTIPIKVINYKDQFLEFNADILDNEFIVNKNLVTDSLMIVTYKKRVPGFWGYFKPKRLTQSVTGTNPNAAYKYQSVVNLKK